MEGRCLGCALLNLGLAFGGLAPLGEKAMPCPAAALASVLLSTDVPSSVLPGTAVVLASVLPSTAVLPASVFSGTAVVLAPLLSCCAASCLASVADKLGSVGISGWTTGPPAW